MVEVGQLRIVEIGSQFIGAAFPETTQSFVRGAQPWGPGQHKLSVPNLSRLRTALRDPALGLIVCRPGYVAPWHWSVFARALFDRRAWLGHPRFGPALAPHLLRLPVTAPIAVVDTEDVPFINRTDLFLLSRCQIYFKRELPPNRWRLFLKTAHSGLPTTRFRRRSPLRHLLDKIRPISLGLPTFSLDIARAGLDKTADVFFAGNSEASSTVRKTGMEELVALCDRGLKVDIPRERLSPQEFYRRCAQAWIIWSPEGHGWECFRHYEALACGSVPLINQPSIERHRPLLEGVHALYYDLEPGGLTRALVRALADKERLRAIARDGLAHVRAHHTHEAIARYVIETTLEAAGRAGISPANTTTPRE